MMCQLVIGREFFPLYTSLNSKILGKISSRFGLISSRYAKISSRSAQISLRFGLISSKSAYISSRSSQVSPNSTAFGKIRQIFSQPKTNRGLIGTRWKFDHPNRLLSPVGNGSGHGKPEVIESISGWAQTRPGPTRGQPYMYEWIKWTNQIRQK